MKDTSYPDIKYNLTGGGIAAYTLAIILYLYHKERNERCRIAIFDQLSDLESTPAANLFLSLTHVEMKAVLPPIKDLLVAIQKPFYEGGVRVEVEGVNDSPFTNQYIEAIQSLADEPPEVTQEREEALTEMGKMSMALWDVLAHWDPKLEAIFKEASYHPCRNPKNEGDELFNQGYRADILFGMQPGEAAKTVNKMCEAFTKDGYPYTKRLSPEELIKHEPSFYDFCRENSELDAQNQRVWKDSAHAILRPGGSINARAFLLGCRNYLQTEMGTYINKNNQEKFCFTTRYGRKVEQVILDNNQDAKGIVYNGRTRLDDEKHTYKKFMHFFCLGGNVGNSLGLPLPPSMGFAGVSFKFEIHDLPEELFKKYQNMNFGGEFHSDNVVLAVQARANEQTKSMLVGAAGTKCLHGDVLPDPNGEFARNRALLELNALNMVFPDLFGRALETNKQRLSYDDLDTLIQRGYVKVLPLVRGVAYHGFSTHGPIKNHQGQNTNTNAIMNGSSGTGSNAPGMVVTTLLANKMTFLGGLKIDDPNKAELILHYSQPNVPRR